MSVPMKVLLVDDHPLIVSALKAMIEMLRPEVRVMALSSAAAVRAALAMDAQHDLVLLDVQLGDEIGFDLLRDLRSSWPLLPVVVLSASDRSSDVIQAIDLGAMGFLPKSMSTEALADALRLVMNGGIFVPTMSLGEEVAPEERPTRANTGTAAKDDPKLPPLEALGLTPRQAEVMTLLLQGQPNKEIARRLSLSVETVKDHVQAVLRALGVSTRTQAVLAVAQMARQGGGGPRS